MNNPYLVTGVSMLITKLFVDKFHDFVLIITNNKEQNFFKHLCIHIDIYNYVYIHKCFKKSICNLLFVICYYKYKVVEFVNK